MGYSLVNPIDDDEKSFLELLEEILASIQAVTPTDINFFIDRFVNFKKEEIKNQKIEIKPGLIMG